MNFYHCANASRSVKLSSGKRVTFEVYKYFAGSWLGVGATDDPETIDGLEELTRKPKSGITRISEEVYKADLKKKPPARNSPRLTESPLLPPQAAVIQNLAGNRVAKVVSGADKKSPSIVAPIVAPKVYDSMDEVLEIGEVKASPSSAPPTKKEEGQSARRMSTSPSRQPNLMSELTEAEKESMNQ